MKKIYSYRFLALFIMTVMIYSSCTKETANVRLDPKLSTSQVLDIKAHSATVVGFVISKGDGFLERGICYDTVANPTIEKFKTRFSGTNEKATFNVVLGQLNYATTYYARAYATNSAGTVYGEEITFTTLPVPPTVTTADISAVTGTTATGGGNVTISGGAAVTARGICYSTSHNPAISDKFTTNGTGTGAFVSNLTGLNGLTTYYVRAYATNSAGTGYGSEVTFTTLVSVRVWNVPGDYVTASYPGTTLANWSPDKSPQIASTKATPDNIEGYVYMANGSNQWKIATKLNWDGPNYGQGSVAGTLDPNGGNFASGPGYYKINVNAAVNPMTYTAIATVWGVIGSATPLGWGDETLLTYNPALRTWNGGIHLTVNEIKFRANHDWSYNYGAPAGKDTLVAGGSNIAINYEADYAITLDLSHPNAYTFSANRWGVIGSATAGGWSSDQDMTWDAVNGVFTVTLNLVAGEIKFRANDDWAVNYGGSLGALTPGGANIPIAADGNYTITLNPWTRVATVTKN